MSAPLAASVELVTAETARQVRVALRTAMAGRTIEQCSGLAGCSANTIARILRGKNVRLFTMARICDRLGAPLVVAVLPNRNM